MAKVGADEGRFGGRNRWEREGGFGGGVVEGEGGGEFFFFYFKYLFCVLIFPFG